MTDPEVTKFLYQGACSCGWHGGWQESDADAKNDSRVHCEGSDDCELSDKVVVRGIGDDLMPHERPGYGTHRKREAL